MIKSSERGEQSAALSDCAPTIATGAVAATGIEPDLAAIESVKAEPIGDVAKANTPNTETVAEATKEAVQVLEPATPNFEAAKTESPKLQNPNLPKSAALKLDWIKPLIAGPLPRNEASAGTKTAARQRRNRKLALVAAALGTAAGLGALLGALAASAPSFPAPAEAAALSTRTEDGLAATIAQLRADVTALKVSVETGTKTTNGQFARIAERFDRLERADLAGRISKAVEALERLERRADASKETTGSVPSAPAALASPLPAPVVPGWLVREVYRGVALIQGPRLGLIEVEAGDVIPGIGRVESIRKQDGHWVVATSKGIIASSR